MLFRSDRKSTRLNSSHTIISYAVFCLKKKRRDRCRQWDGSKRRGGGFHELGVGVPLWSTVAPCLATVPLSRRLASFVCFFFFNDTATTEIYTLSLHDALPI